MEALHIIPARIQAASVLRKAILAGEFSQGQKISLTETAARLGISRTPVREALLMLEGEGLVSLRMNKEAIVNSINEKFISNHYEVRILLEGEAACRAANNHMNTAILEQKYRQIREELQQGDAENYVQINQMIHMQIWNAADNQKLFTMLMNLWNGPSVGRTVDLADHQYKSTIEHGEILDYIKHGEGEKARRAMASHIRRSMVNILQSFQAEDMNR